MPAFFVTRIESTMSSRVPVSVVARIIRSVTSVCVANC
jgi:hypothetical protein